MHSNETRRSLSTTCCAATGEQCDPAAGHADYAFDRLAMRRSAAGRCAVGWAARQVMFTAAIGIRMPSRWRKSAGSARGGSGHRHGQRNGGDGAGAACRSAGGRSRCSQQSAVWEKLGAIGERGGTAGHYQLQWSILAIWRRRRRRSHRARNLSWSKPSAIRHCVSRTFAGWPNWLIGGGAKLLVDNTFASPAICRPLELGADLVMESLTKIMNGHSDALLGMLCGSEAVWQRVPQVSSAWGLMAAPFESWLVERGLGTLHLRVERACANAAAAAKFLASSRAVKSVDYPGLPSHPDHALAVKQFGGRFGNMVTFTLEGGTEAATAVHRGGKTNSVLSVAGRTLHDAEPSGIDQPPIDDHRPARRHWASRAVQFDFRSASSRRNMCSTRWRKGCVAETVAKPQADTSGTLIAMRLAWLTDIHLNFLSDDEDENFFAQIAGSSADAILLTGDIGEARNVAVWLERMDARCSGRSISCWAITTSMAARSKRCGPP